MIPRRSLQQAICNLKKGYKNGKVNLLHAKFQMHQIPVLRNDFKMKDVLHEVQVKSKEAVAIHEAHLAIIERMSSRMLLTFSRRSSLRRRSTLLVKAAPRALNTFHSKVHNSL